MNSFVNKVNNNKAQIALIAAISFHFFGAIGMVQQQAFFINATSLNLVLMAALVIYTNVNATKASLTFAIISFVIGIVVELIGVNTAYLFGNYKYGSILGFKIAGVPLLIGLNWFVTLYCSAHAAQYCLSKLNSKSTLIFCASTALLATCFDWLIEPCAIKLNWWHWATDPNVPLYNYFCWFICSLPIAFFFNKLALYKQHNFALQLFIIQILFFITLRIWL